MNNTYFNLKKRVLILTVIISITFSCTNVDKKQEATLSDSEVKKKILTLNNALVEAAMSKNFDQVADIYAEDALLLAEYNPLIDGKAGIKKYYTEIFKRQNPRTYKKEMTELFNFGKTVLEIGTFQKFFADQEEQSGPYWNVWELQEEGILLLKSETFGFFDQIENPSTLVVDSIPECIWKMRARENIQIPLEYNAYGALMENIVRDRDTKKLLELYTEDGSYTPYLDTTKAGAINLSTHYYAYHKNPVVIDSIETSTYDYILVPNGVIWHTQFYVEWTVPELSGKNEGTGIVYWKRQDENSLRIHRQIGHHTYFDH